MLAAALPSLTVTRLSGPLMSFVACVLNVAPLPELNVMNRCGSLMKFTPTLRSWPRPPLLTCHEKSSRNWNLRCCVVCGALTFEPIETPFGKLWLGSVVRAVMVLPKSANWKMNSFSFDPPSTQLWFRLIELYSFLLSPQLSNVLLGAALYGCEFVSRP